MVCLSGSAAFGQPWDGNGTPNEPYLIYDACDMQVIGADANFWDAHFKLMADINLASYTGTQFNLIGKYVGWNDPNNRPFTGVFDGNGQTISNFTYTTVGTYYVGLFEHVYDGKIEDLRLADSNVNVEMVTYTGSLVGFLENGTISGCYAQGGSVSGGGLVGYIDNGIIANCYSSITVEGGNYTGGLVGENYGGEIYNCCSVGSVSGGQVVGGLVGWNGGIVRDCYSSSDTSGDDEVGGLVGDNDNNSEIIRCYSVGSVSGTSNVGGLVGFNHYVEGVKDSFWDVNTSDCNSSAGGMGMTTAEMQDADTYIFWGCDSVWTINEGVDYPHLAWENKQGEVIDNGCGTENDPYQIFSPGNIQAVGASPWRWDKHFKLMADIDLGGYTGTSLNIIGNSTTKFTGVFDGDGHTISNFTYDSNGMNIVGLFGMVGVYDVNKGEVRNLGLIDPNIHAQGEYCFGCLVGYLDNGTVRNCYVEGGNISGTNFVGGLAGATGEFGLITHCHSSASVSGNDFVGGLTGWNEGKVVHCYSVGDVNGTAEAGGLVGHDNLGVYMKCFWDSDVNPDMNGIGNTTDPNAIGETTANMQTKSTFTDAGWDFVGEIINGPNDIWDICLVPDYPKLAWQWQPPTPDCWYYSTQCHGDVNDDAYLDLIDFQQRWYDWAG
ncbi:MAG: GLUG motif-containing protein [Planctomycetota bacterium]